ncbi:probable carbamoyl transferase [Candidatus Vecturithrix granuli]|uniref:Probable carbamoyl transferase n=1 Tax=Vecturithrix granuli TaxID=1499967 RepID=A0A081C4B7_VECG1|nr:probable carbamoyl transferase [Candidatus Vecturithrix granuli]
MRILGISPLDKNTTICLVEDGKIIAAMGEERFSRQKMHSGFPHLALQELFTTYRLTADDIDYVAYAFFDADTEKQMMQQSQQWYQEKMSQTSSKEIFSKFRNLPAYREKFFHIPGLSQDKLYMKKPWHMNLFYTLASTLNFLGNAIQQRYFDLWIADAFADHAQYQTELLQNLQKFGLTEKLVRFDHHLCHSANAYYTSGFDEALIVTLDGYGSGLAGSIAVGKNGKIERIHGMRYPVSLGEFYERVTSSLGFRPGRHEGKIVGLAAYDDPNILFETVRSFFEVKDGEVLYKLPHNFFLVRYLASRYPKPTVGSAFQKVLEDVSCEYVSYYQKQTGLKNIVVSGGVVANVKANQRLFEIPGIEKIFIHPAMGDDGCCVGAALLLTSQKQDLKPYELKDVYLGPGYTEEEMEEALKQEGLVAERPENLPKRVAELLVDGKIVARFNGRMEYGPRALGNRTIMYHAKDPSVNLWLNTQLKRTEFMPFAPATLYEHREKCYKNIQGAEYAANFMTITFDCTDFMIKQCPAAVHVDKTARPQLVRKEVNESFYQIIEEYYKLTGNPSIINTSFNMHEEPIVCTPFDAIRAFKLGHLHYLAMGPFLVKGEEV